MPPTCSIQYRPDLRLLVVRWPADAPFAQLQVDFETVLHAAQQHQAARWLLDVRRREELTPDLARWTTHEFFPRAAAALQPQVLRIGVLASPARMAVYEQGGVQRETLEFGLDGARPYRMQLFGDEGAVVQWLET